jgi:hypothetical protein
MRCSLRLLLLLLLVVVRSRMKLFIEDAGISVGGEIEGGRRREVCALRICERERTRRERRGREVGTRREAGSVWRVELEQRGRRSRGQEQGRG